jgi:hypothetical protein
VADDNKLRLKLERLYKLAILREEEEKDESRHNEARTSAFLLIKIARENGVKIIFKVPPQKEAPPPPPTTSRYEGVRWANPSTAPRRPTGPVRNPFNDFFSGAGADVFEDMFRDMNRRQQEEQAERERRDRETRKRREEARQEPFVGADTYAETARDHERRPGESDEEYRERLLDLLKSQGPGFKRPQRQNKKSTRGAPPLIVAKYAGVCRVCRKQYNLGDGVYWIQGWGCSHEACGYEELMKQAANG